MKTIIAIALGFVLLAVGGCTGFYFGAARAKRLALAVEAGNAPVESAIPATVGKFQIVTGEYIFHSGSEDKEKGVFRVNTETGETFLYVQLVDANGKLETYWSPIEQR
jgi:hypothetical protein